MNDYFPLTNNSDIDLSEYAKTTDLSTVATTGSYDDLTNKPQLSNTIIDTIVENKIVTYPSGTQSIALPTTLNNYKFIIVTGYTYNTTSDYMQDYFTVILSPATILYKMYNTSSAAIPIIKSGNTRGVAVQVYSNFDNAETTTAITLKSGSETSYVSLYGVRIGA